MGLAGLTLYNYFLYDNQPLPYNRLPYGNCSERTIEIPIALHFLLQSGAGKQEPFLEIGNVLENYQELLDAHPSLSNRLVIDEHEESSNVLNIDLMAYETKHSLILCLSTAEHYGQHAYDEHRSDDREAPLRMIRQIYNLLEPNGVALITVPYGKLMDCDWLIQFSKEYVDLLFDRYDVPRKAASITFFRKQDMDMHHHSPRQSWIQCEAGELAETRFDSPFMFANGLAFIQLRKIGKDVTTPIPSGQSSLRYIPAATVSSLYFNPFIKPSGNDSSGFLTVNRSGYVFYGPSISIAARPYQLLAMIELSGTGLFTLEVTADQGNKVLWSRPVSQSETVQAQIQCATEEKDVEIRLYKHNNSTCSVKLPFLLLTEG